MLPALAVAAGLASFSLAPGADTTLAISPGLRLDVANYAGEVFIEGWNKNALRIRTDHSDEDKVLVFPARGGIGVKAYSKHEDDRSADLRLIVPVWMNVAVSGIHTDVIVTGTQAQIKVETVHGDVIVRGGRERIDLNTVNDDICVSDADGTVHAETVNGDAYVWRTESDSVDISTVNGDVVYEGSMETSGSYRFATHNGDLAVAMPGSASAAVQVSTFSGDFESNFPVTLTGNQSSKNFQFCIGTCSARVELQSFQGSIQIYRASATTSARVQRMDEIVDRIIEKRLDKKVDRIPRMVRKMDRNKKRHDGSDHDPDDEE